MMKSKDNNLIQKREYYIILFDYYGELLTNKQKEYFKEFYFNDLTLSEIGENYNISRSAVFDAIEKIHKSFDEYENILGLYKKNSEREKLYAEYENKQGLFNELINKLKEIE